MEPILYTCTMHAQGLRANVGTLIFKTRLVFTRQKRCWHTGVHPPKEVLTHWCSPDRRGVSTLVFTQHDYIQREHNYIGNTIISAHMAKYLGKSPKIKENNIMRRNFSNPLAPSRGRCYAAAAAAMQRRTQGGSTPPEKGVRTQVGQHLLRKVLERSNTS